MKTKFNILEKIIFLCNKLFYSWTFLVVLFLGMYFLYKYVECNIFFLLALLLLLLVYWINKLIFIPKNKSGKYGIVFLVNNGEAYDDKINEMFKKIKFILRDNFSIYVFNNNFLKNINTSEKKDKVLFKKGYHMIINLYAFKGNENSESICSLTNEDITVIAPWLDEVTMDNLRNDFKYAFKKIMKLSEQNSYTDVTENASLLSLSIRYYVSIIYIIFGNLEQAEVELSKMNFENLPPTDKIVQYLRRSVVRRYADIYFIRMLEILYKYEYLYDVDKFTALCNEEKKLLDLIGSINSDISDIKYNNNDIKSKILFVDGKYYESISCLDQMIKKNPNDYGPKLSKAFVKTYQGDLDGVLLYKKLSKRNVDLEIVKGCINFIDNALKNSKFNSTMLLVCKSILIYYWVNKNEGKDLLLSVINKIADEDFKNNLKMRYLNNN